MTQINAPGTAVSIAAAGGIPVAQTIDVAPIGGGLANTGSWAATTHYTQGELVLSPAGAYLAGVVSLVQAVATHTSGGTFSQASWTRLADIKTGSEITYRGAWAAATAYSVSDAVIELGALYVCTTAHTSGASFAGTNWTQLSPQSGAYVGVAPGKTTTGTSVAPYVSAADYTGVSAASKLDAAIASLGSSVGWVFIPASIGTGEPSATPITAVLIDQRGGLPGEGLRFNTSSVPVGGQQAEFVYLRHSVTSPSTSYTTHYVQLITVGGTHPTNNTLEALSGSTAVQGSLTTYNPTGSVVSGGEANANIQSTGGSVPTLCGWTVGTNLYTGSTTNVGDIRNLWVKQTQNGGTGTVLNAYSVVAESQSIGAARNYALWTQGNSLSNNNTARTVLDSTGVTATGCATAPASNVLSCTNAAFTAGMVGRPITVVGAASGGGDLMVTISAFTDSGHVAMSQTAGASTSGGVVSIPGAEIQIEVDGRGGGNDQILYQALSGSAGWRWGATGGFDYMDLTQSSLTVKVGANFTGNTVVNGSGAGLAFFGGTAVAKQTITGALSSVTDANAKAVLTAIVNALTNYTLIANSTT